MRTFLRVYMRVSVFVFASIHIVCALRHFKIIGATKPEMDMINLFDSQLSGDLINRWKSTILFQIGICTFVFRSSSNFFFLVIFYFVRFVEHKLDVFHLFSLNQF